MKNRLNTLHAFTVLCSVSLCLIPIPGLSAPSQVQRYDFQPAAGPVAAGFTAVTPADTYTTNRGLGFTNSPATAVDGSRQAWQIFDRLVPVNDAIPSAVLPMPRAIASARGARGHSLFARMCPPAITM